MDSVCAEKMFLAWIGLPVWEHVRQLTTRQKQETIGGLLWVWYRTITYRQTDTLSAILAQRNFVFPTSILSKHQSGLFDIAMADLSEKSAIYSTGYAFFKL